MSNRVTLAKSPSSRGVKMPTKEKKCSFPGCNNVFTGIGASKYCPEHRSKEARKVINKIRSREKELRANPEKPQNSNTYIKHNNAIATEITRTCICGAEYKIKLFPGVDVYPKYCEKHRNPYQRKRLLDKLGIEDIDDTITENSVAEIEIDDISTDEIVALENEFGDELFGGEM